MTDRTLHFLARVLLAALFLAGFAQKALDPDPARALLRGAGLAAPLVWPAAAFNLGAGLALVVGWRVRPVALCLAAYCAVTSAFHLIPGDPWQISIFVKNWAIAGGCLALAVAARKPPASSFILAKKSPGGRAAADALAGPATGAEPPSHHRRHHAPEPPFARAVGWGFTPPRPWDRRPNRSGSGPPPRPPRR